MALTPEQRRLREGKLTASAVGALMSGDHHKILNLWRLMVGDDGFQEDDLSRVWPVRLGETTEGLNLGWYEYKLDRELSRQGEVVVHPRRSWACATLDAFDSQLVGPIDAKHVGGYETREKVVARYYPQMTWQMDCTETKRSALSIIEGAKEPAIEIIEWDAAYSLELWRRASEFMRFVDNLTPPVDLPAINPPPPAVREVDMSGSNTWAQHAHLWSTTRAYARTFAKAEIEIKALIADDVARAHGHGIVVTRDKARRLTIREIKS